MTLLANSWLWLWILAANITAFLLAYFYNPHDAVWWLAVVFAGGFVLAGSHYFQKKALGETK